MSRYLTIQEKISISTRQLRKQARIASKGPIRNMVSIGTKMTLEEESFRNYRMASLLLIWFTETIQKMGMTHFMQKLNVTIQVVFLKASILVVPLVISKIRLELSSFLENVYQSWNNCQSLILGFAKCFHISQTIMMNNNTSTMRSQLDPPIGSDHAKRMKCLSASNDYPKKHLWLF